MTDAAPFAALPRQIVGWYGWKPDKPDPRDHRMSPMVSHPPPAAALNEVFLPTIRDQGAQGSCTGHATRSAISYLRKAERQSEQFDPSPRFIYYNGRVIEGTSGEDSGCEIRDVIKAVNKLGVCPERLCPYKPSNYARKPGAGAYRAALNDLATEYARVPQTVANLKATIAAGHPIVFGFSVFEDFEGDEMARTGLLRMPQPSWKMVGGHAVWIVGYDDAAQVYDQKGAFKIGNSWGADWGQGGYFLMPYAYISTPDLADDFWTIRKVS